jgi:hypothetical protein
MKITRVEVKYKREVDGFSSDVHERIVGDVQARHTDGGTIVWNDEYLTDAQVQQIGYVILHRDRDGLPLPVEPYPTGISVFFNLVCFMLGALVYMLTMWIA